MYTKNNYDLLGDERFILVNLQYKFGDKLQSLLEVGGGKVCSLEVFCLSSQVCELLLFFLYS